MTAPGRFSSGVRARATGLRAARPVGVLAALAVSTIAACEGGGLDPRAGDDVAFRVHEASFQPDLSLPEPEAEPGKGLAVTLVETQNRTMEVGVGTRGFSGRIGKEGTAVAVALVGDAPGAWTVPAGGPDPSAGGELTWSLGASLVRPVAPGLHKLRFAAVDDAGQPKGSKDVEICVLPPYPDNLNTCDPTIVPPAGVLTLAWDSAADLDLVVSTPAGKRVDGGSPQTKDAGQGVLVGDGGGCGAPGPRREHLVWAQRPPNGSYGVWVRLFDACGAEGVRFTVTLRVAYQRDDGTWGMREALSRKGVLSAADAAGTDALGTFVLEFSP